MERKEEGLKALGSKTVYRMDYAPEVLEAFENRHQGNDYWVRFNCPEFTTLCPITGQPDFAEIRISYIPDKRMVESKSLKLYLLSFRNHGDFHEDSVNTIMKDLIKLMDPRYIEVTGFFTPRGGISIHPYANYVSCLFIVLNFLRDGVLEEVCYLANKSVYLLLLLEYLKREAKGYKFVILSRISNCSGNTGLRVTEDCVGLSNSRSESIRCLAHILLIIQSAVVLKVTLESKLVVHCRDSAVLCCGVSHPLEFQHI